MTPLVAILRLTTGEDIIGLVSETEAEYQVVNPFKVIFRRFSNKNNVGLMVVPWLLDELLDEHTTVISKSQVVCVMTPKKEFVDYYHRTSDDYYMRLINLDSAFRNQLSNLERRSLDIESSFRDMMNNYYSSKSNWTDEARRQDEDNEDEDDDFPTFH